MKSKTSRILGTLLFLFAVLLFTFAADRAASAEVVKIKVDDTIQPITAEYIDRAINHANQIHASALLIEMSTPGGLETSMRDIVSKILESPVPVIIYVAPSGSRAASAGFFILESADIAAMAPGTNTGSAHPVTMTGSDIPGDMRKKVENDAAAFLRSYVSKRGRNVELAESAVRESKSWSNEEALKNNLIDVVAKNQSDLFQQLQGRTVTLFNGNKVQLNLVGQPVQKFDMTVKQHVLDFMMNPNMAFIIFAIGMLALYVEFNHPGAVIPGVVGLIFVVLAVFAFNILPIRYAAVGLILLAFVLFVLDAKFATHGVLTVAGIACMVVGALLLVDSPIPEMRVQWATALAVSVPIGAITAFLVGIAIRARRNKVAVGPQALIGKTGIARTPLVPEGKISIHGEIWDADSSGNVDEGATVIVRGVDGLRLKVEPAAVSRVPEQRLEAKRS
jgi:membrane-bound serine protease (ClpP class)